MRQKAPYLDRNVTEKLAFRFCDKARGFLTGAVDFRVEEKTGGIRVHATYMPVDVLGFFKGAVLITVTLIFGQMKSKIWTEATILCDKRIINSAGNVGMISVFRSQESFFKTYSPRQSELDLAFQEGMSELSIEGFKSGKIPDEWAGKTTALALGIQQPSRLVLDNIISLNAEVIEDIVKKATQRSTITSVSRKIFLSWANQKRTSG